MDFTDERGVARARQGSISRSSPPQVIFRTPRAEDGPAVSRLIAQCPPLDANSAYCNLLQCTHFAETCLIAERAGVPAGWISAYRVPAAPDRLFIWQIAVPATMRGLGIGRRMLEELLNRQAVRGVDMIESTITDANAASWALFRSVARSLGAELSRQPLFDRNIHFAGSHDTEHLVRIGPLAGTQVHRQQKEKS